MSSQSAAALIQTLRAITGAAHVLTGDAQTRGYRTGYRFGSGAAIAVVRPGSLIEQWRVLKACIGADKIVIMQAANTGLTGGSTPDGDDYDREIVIISTMRMKQAHLIDEGRQVICFPGATLDQLEQMLKPLGREPHSVIGSSCIGASVLGGICNNSGGALVQRGPAYTEMALFAQVGADGVLRLVNHLGVALGSDPESMLERLERREYTAADFVPDAGRGSDQSYAKHVRDIDSDRPARYNADPSRLYEASGSAGKLILFAVRLDTFPAEAISKVFYIGTNEAGVFTDLRRRILAEFPVLPVAGEYMHRSAFDIAEEYGKDVFLLIDWLGTARMPQLFAFKSRCDAWCDRLKLLPKNLPDRVLQLVSRLLPSHLPRRIKDYRDRYEHHLMLKVAGPTSEDATAFLTAFFAAREGAYFECDAAEAKKAFLHRFAVAGASVRYRAVHSDTVEDIVAIDVALRRNDRDWIETLPVEIEARISKKILSGHFLCHVFHQDYIVPKGGDCVALEHDLLAIQDRRGAEYPAEHNVGHLYRAKPQLVEFYRTLDPCNHFNPGIGQTSKRKAWSLSGCAHRS